VNAEVSLSMSANMDLTRFGANCTGNQQSPSEEVKREIPIPVKHFRSSTESIGCKESILFLSLSLFRFPLLPFQFKQVFLLLVIGIGAVLHNVSFSFVNKA
jgi:hypothetical protein